MADAKVPLLMNGLTLPERVMLAGSVRHVGFPIIVKLCEAIVERAQQDVARVDPEKEPNYERVLAYRQQRFRVANESTRDLLDAIAWHVEMASKLGQDADLLDSQLQLQEE